MGKRQLGELQPTELVITILLSEIASIPIEDNGVPLVNSIFAVLLLVSLEIINSAVCLKSAKIRSLVEGNPMIVIRHGKVDQKKLKQLRFSSEDLIEQLRQKDVFDINDVKFAVIETNGQLSVMLKDDKQPITPETLDSEQKSKSLQCMVINDGRIISKSFRDCNMDEKKLKNILKNNKVKQEEILFMLADDMGNYSIVRKEIET
ncbi:MAG: DUF421 domain-containing protein [Clostridia bacterium]|nr:DUF421 domain-containing protein [Clostridia bacterium]